MDWFMILDRYGLPVVGSIAMAFYIASLLAKRTAKIDDLDCINISFPDFFDKIREISL